MAFSISSTQGLRVVLIDYLQRLNLPRRIDVRHDEEVGMVTTLFKRLAVELNLWIFILSATNDEGQVKDYRGPEFDADFDFSLVARQQRSQCLFPLPATFRVAMRARPNGATGRKATMWTWRSKGIFVRFGRG